MSIREPWNNLAKHSKTPLLRHEWFLSCLKAFYRKEEIYIMVEWDGAEIIAAAPLILVRRQGVQQLELIGVSHLHEPCGLLFKDVAALKMLIDELTSIDFSLGLTKINKETAYLIQKRVSGRQGLSFLRPTAPSSFLSCNTSWDDYYSSISAQRRYDHRRAKKKAEQSGKLAFQIDSPRPDNYEYFLEQAARVEAAGWKRKKGSALLINLKLRSFFLEYAKWAANQDMLRIFFLHIDGQVAAMQMCVEYADKLWVLKIGYDEKWSACSPGVLLMKYALQYAFENGLESIEFLGSKEPWLEVWTNEYHTYSSMVFYPYTVPGVLGLGTDILRTGIHRLKKLDKVIS